MDYEVLDNFCQRYGEDRLYEFLEWLNEGKSYESIGRILHVSPSRVCRLANRMFERRWAPTGATVLLLKHRHAVCDYEQQDRREQLDSHSVSKILLLEPRAHS